MTSNQVFEGKKKKKIADNLFEEVPFLRQNEKSLLFTT